MTDIKTEELKAKLEDFNRSAIERIKCIKCENPDGHAQVIIDLDNRQVPEGIVLTEHPRRGVVFLAVADESRIPEDNNAQRKVILALGVNYGQGVGYADPSQCCRSVTTDTEMAQYLAKAERLMEYTENSILVAFNIFPWITRKLWSEEPVRGWQNFGFEDSVAVVRDLAKSVNADALLFHGRIWENNSAFRSIRRIIQDSNPAASGFLTYNLSWLGWSRHKEEDPKPAALEKLW